MNIQVPTRTVSGTGSYNRDVVLQGRWQEHTSTDEDSGSSTSGISLVGTWQESTTTKNGTTTVSMSGTWSSDPVLSGDSNVFQYKLDVPASATWSGTNVKSWTSGDIESGPLGYVSAIKLTDRGTVPSGASISTYIAPDRLSWSVTISARRTIQVEPTTIKFSVTVRELCAWIATDNWSISTLGLTNAEITEAALSSSSGATSTQVSHTDTTATITWVRNTYPSSLPSGSVKISYNYDSTTWTASSDYPYSSSHDTTNVTGVTFSAGIRPSTLTYSGNTIIAYWETTSAPGISTVSCTARVSYDWTDTISTSYWTATDSYTLSNTGATITHATYVTGTQPSDVNYSGRTITLSWYSSTEPSGNVAGTTMRLTYSAPYSSTYANVYFNGTRVNYVYFNGTRYP